jgi:hypothetical protein
MTIYKPQRSQINNALTRDMGLELGLTADTVQNKTSEIGV